jgi:hypothetical protein
MKDPVDLTTYVVPFEKLRWVCSQDLFPFECTTDIEPLKEFIGQERALGSINFGLEVERTGYNLFLTGLTGTGKASTIKSRLERFIEERNAKGIQYQTMDWCYVYNSCIPTSPHHEIASGFGRSFANDMKNSEK